MAKVGRPTVFTPEVIGKIEEIAALDGSVEEMALFAGINRDTIYSKLQDDKEFSDRIEELRAKPVLLARRTVNKKMVESYANSMDYLKRKRKLEFGDNVDVTTGGEKLPQPLINLDALLSNNKSQEDSPIKKED